MEQNKKKKKICEKITHEKFLVTAKFIIKYKTVKRKKAWTVYT